VIISTTIPEARWDAFVERQAGATSYHLWRWRRVMERAFGHHTVYLAACDRDEVVGVLPAVLIKSWMFGRSLVSLPFVNYGGVLATTREARHALVEEAAAVATREGAAHVELRHLVRHFDDLPVKQHKVTMLLRLPSTEAEAWQQLDRKVRNQVKKAEKSGLTAETGDAELLPDFYSVFSHNMRDLGTPVYTRALFEAVLSEFSDRTRVFVVRADGEPVAAGIGHRFRDTVEMPWASSLRAARPLCANTLLYWHAIRDAIASGVTTFDFGRSTPGDGPYQFKQQWGAEPVPLAWEYRLLKGDLPNHSPSNPKFSAAVAVWKRLPVSVATWLGPSIVRSIP
jgi:FemAB-related protein (PEP-CTERM system-associated)